MTMTHVVLSKEELSILIQQALETCWAIEECGASPKLTDAVTKASIVLRALNQKYSNFTETD